MNHPSTASDGLSSTKRKLFELMLERERANERAASERIPRVDRSQPLPLSFAQQRLWFLDRLEPGSYAYNLPLIVRLRGALDVAILSRSLDELVRRHEVLRTRFALRDGHPVQIVAEELQVPLAQVDLRAVAGGLEPEAVAEIDNRRPYDLATGPLLRATLVRTADSDHLFILNVHHIVSDGWSLEVLVREIGGLYQAFSAGEPSPFDELPIQYGDFAVWQREMLRGEVYSEQLEYWERLLESAPAVLELPADHPRPPIQGFAGRTQTFALPSALSAEVRALARAEDATLFTVLLSVFEILLERYTGQRDLVVGTPVANRNRVQLEGLIGFFVNTLVLRTEVTGDPDFRRFLQQVRRGVVGALQHQDVPFEKLVEELQPRRDVSRSPLFQVMFALQTKPDLEQEFAGVRLTAVEIDPRTSKFDLTLTLEETPQGFFGKLEYPVALFEPSTVRRMSRHFETLLESVVEDPGRRLSGLPLLTAAERRQLMEWNATGAADGRELPIQQLLENRAASDPDAVAVSFEQQALTYRELDRRAGRLATELVSLGIEAETPVGIEVERSPAMLVAVLGVLKAGAAYLPLDPTYPEERLSFMLEDAGAPVVVTEGRFVGSFADYPGRLVVLDDGDEEREVPGDTRARRISGGNLAYLIYTSGSTGRPKGVQVHHRAVVNFLASMARQPGLGSADVVVAVTTLGFDIAGLELLLPLAVGARVVLADRQTAADGAALSGLLARSRATAMQATPATWRLLLAAEPQLPRLKVLCGGEALSRELADRMLPLASSVWNLYGPTETTIWSALERVRSAPGPVLLGRPIANTQVWLVDRLLRPVPVGVPGELLIGGDGLARGYFRRSALTASKFVPDAAGNRTAGARLYRTGDLARQRADGRIEFLGRLDHQVKIRGFRIELGEIEAALTLHPAVRQAVVTVHEPGAGDQRLVAYVTPAGELDPTIDELRQFLSARLPEAFLPSLLVVLEELPLTPNNKVDRRALPAPEGSRPQLDVAYAAPRNELESRLVQIWKDLLQVDDVGVKDNFFDLGGHSLLLVEAHGRLREELGMELSVVDLFQYPTIHSLAAYLAGDDLGAPRQEQSETRGLRRRQASRGDVEIAIVGMALRLPDADSPEAFWENLRQGVNSIRFFSAEHALAAGVTPERLQDPSYVLAEASLGEQLKWFDASFFGYSPREAELIDPQQRLFLEACWEALERAGYCGETYGGRVGVFGSAAVSSYLQENLQGYAEDYDAMSVMSDYFLRVTLLSGNTNDFLAQRIAYHLGLDGPCLNVQTACSSSVVAVHLAAESLRNQECDMALAGGVQVRVPEKIGYQYLDGGLPSPDGQCRPFDARAQGTVHGNGLGVVVLKRLQDAIEDGDEIVGVIKGSAVNNDGAQRVGFTAPSVEGQTKVIAEALAVAGVPADSVGFVEAHGTATDLGDPIEVSALTQAFRAHTRAKGFCALGSLKSNLGHLDTSAGVASLIKAALAVQHGEVPPTVHFEKPNPKLDLENSPFFVNSALVPWPDQEQGRSPRRAAVNTFAIGGTNVNLVLEQAPARESSGDSRPWQLVVLSARTSTALHAATAGLTAFLRDRRGLDLADVAFTLSVGRKAFRFRRAVLCRSVEELVDALDSLDSRRVTTELAEQGSRSVTMLFPGEGRPRSLAAGLYEAETVFRRNAEQCCELMERVQPGIDLRGALLGSGDVEAEPLALFTAEYALARLWMEWGVEPVALAGVGIGEIVAACLAGTLSLESGLKLVYRRVPGDSERSLKAPALPLLSATTGDWLPPQEATQPAFWERIAKDRDDLRPAVGRLAEKLVEQPGRVLLEVASGNALCREVEDHPDFSFDQLVLPSAPPGETEPVQAQLIATLGRLWAAGLAVDWGAFWRGERRHRLTLPTYPFERQSFWIERRLPSPDASGRKPVRVSPSPAAEGTESRFQVPSWTRSMPQREHVSTGPSPNERWLVLAEGEELSRRIVRRLQERGLEVTVVEPGESFEAGGGWTIRPSEAGDYRAVLDELRGAGCWPRHVLLLWDLSLSAELAATGLSLLAAALRSAEGTDAVNFVVVTVAGQEVLGDEAIRPEAAALAALCDELFAAPHRCRLVDLVLPEPGGSPEALADRLLEEPGFGSRDTLVAYRGSHRWVPTLVPFQLPLTEVATEDLRPDGAWLLIGGAGGPAGKLAVELARMVPRRPEEAQSHGLRWAIIEPTGFPEPGAWEERLAEPTEGAGEQAEILRLRVLEDLASDFLMLTADLPDEWSLAAALDRAVERFGELDGVLYSTGLVDAATSFEGNEASWNRAVQLEMRVLGALERLLSGRSPRFCFVCCDASKTKGDESGLAQAALTAATPAFVQRHNQSGEPRWLALSLSRGAATVADADIGRLSLAAADLGLGQVIVGHAEMQAKRPPSEPSIESSRHRRPDLAEEYVAPRNELERLVADAWAEVLGIEGIGIHDEFYELGGNSLVATRLVSRLREVLHVELSLRELLELRSVAEVAAALEQGQFEATEAEEIGQLLDELEGMSSEEVERLVGSEEP